MMIKVKETPSHATSGRTGGELVHLGLERKTSGEIGVDPESLQGFQVDAIKRVDRL